MIKDLSDDEDILSVSGVGAGVVGRGVVVVEVDGAMLLAVGGIPAARDSVVNLGMVVIMATDELQHV